MKSLFLSKSERDIIVFHIWRSLKYELRIVLSLGLISGGFFWQANTFSVFPGLFLVIGGVLLVLTKGYNNKVDFGKFRVDSDWEKTDIQKLHEIVELQRKMKKWDRDAIDITNNMGCIILFLIIISLVIVLYLVSVNYNLFYSLNIFLLNTLVIILPFWVTGVRKITKMPALVNKINLFENLILTFTENLKPHKVEYYVMLAGKEKKMPKDIKIKINVKDQPDNFLGVYGQISINSVSGVDYPYFYMVIVAYKTFGLEKYVKKIELPKNIIKEYKVQNDVEIIVIRQYTTRTSGYQTKPDMVKSIFNATMYNVLEILKS